MTSSMRSEDVHMLDRTLRKATSMESPDILLLSFGL